MYDKLKEEKEKAMKIGSSNANYILNETVNSFQKKWDYLEKFISIRENYEEIIRYDNTITE